MNSFANKVLNRILYVTWKRHRQSILEQILTALDITPRELMRTGEKEYKELGLDDPELGRETLIKAMVDTPKLIERPIVIRGNKVALGRPPENVLNIL